MARKLTEKRVARVERHRYLLGHPHCEVRHPVTCSGAASHVHHRLRRSQGGKDVPENFVAVCVRCHDLIHREPKWAYANGWMVRSWDTE